MRRCPMQRCHIVTGTRDASRTRSRVSGDACSVHNQDLHASIEIVIALWQRNSSTLASGEKRGNSSVWSNSWGWQRESVYDTTLSWQCALSITWGTRRTHSSFATEETHSDSLQLLWCGKCLRPGAGSITMQGTTWQPWRPTVAVERCLRWVRWVRWVPGCVFWSRVRLISLMHWRPAKYDGGYGND